MSRATAAGTLLVLCRAGCRRGRPLSARTSGVPGAQQRRAEGRRGRHPPAPRAGVAGGDRRARGQGVVRGPPAGDRLGARSGRRSAHVRGSAVERGLVGAIPLGVHRQRRHHGERSARRHRAARRQAGRHRGGQAGTRRGRRVRGGDAAGPRLSPGRGAGAGRQAARARRGRHPRDAFRACAAAGDRGCQRGDGRALGRPPLDRLRRRTGQRAHPGGDGRPRRAGGALPRRGACRRGLAARRRALAARALAGGGAAGSDRGRRSVGAGARARRGPGAGRRGPGRSATETCGEDRPREPDGDHPTVRQRAEARTDDGARSAARSAQTVGGGARPAAGHRLRPRVRRRAGAPRRQPGQMGPRATPWCSDATSSSSGSAKAGWRRSSSPRPTAPRGSSATSWSSGCTRTWRATARRSASSSTRRGCSRCWSTPTSSRCSTSAARARSTSWRWSTSTAATSSDLVRRHVEVFGRPLSLPAAFYVMHEVLEALAYAHGRADVEGKMLGIVHRDVAPGNVLVSMRGEVKLSDFGIAKSAARMSRTEVGMIKGNVSFMPPEQARGEPVDHRSDLFSAAVVLYYCLTAQFLYRERSLFSGLARAAIGPDAGGVHPARSDPAAGRRCPAQGAVARSGEALSDRAGVRARSRRPLHLGPLRALRSDGDAVPRAGPRDPLEVSSGRCRARPARRRSPATARRASMAGSAGARAARARGVAARCRRRS